MAFLVMGAGSIGSVVGGLLYEAGFPVYLLGLGDHMEAVSRRGLLIGGIWGTHRVRGIPASSRIADLAEDGFRPDWTLLTVKSYDTGKALEDLEPVLEGQRGIISLQNGLGNLEAIERFAPGKAVGGRVIFGARTLEPGSVEVTVCADDVLLGPPPGGPDGVPEVVKAFSRAGIPCRFETGIRSFIWDKVLYNVCLNALATLLGTDYGHVGGDENAWKIIKMLVEESYRVARAERVEPVSPNAEDYLRRLSEELLPPTREHRSSMQEDVAMGRRTEIDALNGAVWALGRKNGIPTPANEILTRLVHFLEARS